MMQKRRVCSKVLGAIFTSLMLLAMVPSVAFADGFSVTYDVNRPDSYSLYATNTPVDESSPYASGATVTVLSDIYANGIHAFDWAGHEFTGWNTSADGTGTSYADSQSVKDLTTTDGATVTLYAQWKANPVFSSVVDNGGATTTTSSASIPQTGDQVSLFAFVTAMLFVIGTSIVGISLKVRRRTHHS